MMRTVDGALQLAAQPPLQRAELVRLAASCGFDLAGVTPALPHAHWERYQDWVSRGLAAGMTYLTDHRAEVRADPRSLMPAAKSILCVAALYNARGPDVGAGEGTRGWISRYAWGKDYHEVLRPRLERLAAMLPAESRVCLDTAPLLERSYAEAAGLGWIGKNTCLIHQRMGSWFFLGAILLAAPVDRYDEPPAPRCGSCTRCVDACPTEAIVPHAGGGFELDARRCISYHTIESRQAAPLDLRAGHGRHVFGCDICQDVCPWNRRAPMTLEQDFQMQHAEDDLEELAALTPEEFRARYRQSPVWRAKHRGFLRNVALAMGNAAKASFRPALERLAAHDDPAVREHAQWGLSKLEEER
jgi:epoxyqueuosine reductase